MRRSVVEHETRLHIRRDLIVAAIAAAIALILCQFGPIDGRPVLGYAATLFAVAATAMAAPAFVTGVIRTLRGALKQFGGAAGLIAGRSLVASLARTSVVVTALATAISMMVASASWSAVSAKRYRSGSTANSAPTSTCAPQGRAAAGIFPPIAAAVEKIVEQTPGVAEVDVFHAFEFRYEGTRATFGAGKMDIVRRRRSLRFLIRRCE